MKTLSYQTLEEIGYSGYLLKNAPEKVAQFGEGNFLRAFADYWFDLANEKAGWNGKCVVIKPRPARPGSRGIVDRLNEQEGLYTVSLRGREKEETIDQTRVISSISRCIDPHTEDGFEAFKTLAESRALEIVVSNTTEAGIVYDPGCSLTDRPCASFPGKLTQFLYFRWKAGQKGLILLPCELIDHNGQELLNCVKAYAVQWGLPEAFVSYIESECRFCSTLVDRIVPGGINNPQTREALDRKNGYADPLLDVSEVFGVWNIEGDAELERRLPFSRAGLPCTVVPDVTPYKTRKVRILNGAHTGFVPGAYLAGFDIVRDCMLDDVVSGFMNRMLREEIIPLLPLDRSELEAFAAAVKDRFNNPFIDHPLISISLNSTSKWLARNLPSLIEYYEKNHSLPECLSMSFAAYIAFYSSGVQALQADGLVCRRENGETYLCRDDKNVLEFFFAHQSDSVPELVHAVMTERAFWNRDLTELHGFEEKTAKNLTYIREHGAYKAFAACL